MRVGQAYSIDVSNPDFEWQRDYIYYGITPTVPKGRLKSNFYETIRSLRLTNAGITRMSGFPDDPKAPTIGGDYAYTQTNSPTAWTDGNYEFLITILFNPRDGTPPQTNARINAYPSDVYDITYSKFSFPFANPNYYYYRVESVTPKEFYPNYAVATWDLQNFGTAWTYHIYEENQTIVRTEQVKVTTSYATNFELDLTFTGFVKGGAKFGASGSKSEERTVTAQYTEGSTDLGEKIMYFYNPVIINATPRCCGLGPLYETYEIAPGGSASNVFLSVEPWSIVPAENNQP